MKITYNHLKEYGEGYSLIRLINACNMQITLSTCGAGIREIKLPDKSGKLKTVTLQPVEEREYLQCYHGKTIGRTSGRIENATFCIDGKTATLDKNNFGTDNLHGGATGLHAKIFSYAVMQNSEFCDVSFSYFSPNGEGGYFGNVKITVTYRIYERENRFVIFFDGKTDEKTLLNLTNHVYWNLSGNATEKTTKHSLFLNAERYAVPDERFIARGSEPVSQAFDFTRPREIGEKIEKEEVQRYTKGYDHPFFLNKNQNDAPDCWLYCPQSGVRLQVKTTYPCVVLYTNNFPLQNTQVFKGKEDEKYLAVCLECQYPPDGIHQAVENCGIFSTERPYCERTEYTFEIIQ